MQISFECEQCGRFYKVEELKVGQEAVCRDCGAELRVPVPGPIADDSHELPSESFSPAALSSSVISDNAADAAMSESEMPQLAVADLNASIAEHIEQHVGAVHRVWHEINPGTVQVDVVQIAPTEERPFWTLITLGMSHQAMHTTDDAQDYSRAELMLCLPKDWPLEEHDLRSEQHYWPIGLLKSLATLPFEHRTWIGPGHTIPNGGEQLQPYTHSTAMCCTLVLPPLFQLPEEMHLLTQPNGTAVRFYNVWTLYAEEVQWKIDHGLESLLDRMHKFGVTETVSSDRKNVTEKKSWKFWR
jgi:hypothetical protein